MTRLVVVVPLREGTGEKVRELLAEGPPFDLEQTRFDRHDVFLTASEAVFVFETAGLPATLELSAEDPSLWKAAAAWRQCMAGRPRKAEVAFTWERPE